MKPRCVAIALAIFLLLRSSCGMAALDQPECVHWYATPTTELSAPFLEKAIVRPSRGGKVFLHKPHPSICKDRLLAGAPECDPKPYTIKGDRVTINFSCADWSWISLESKVCRTPQWVTRTRTRNACTYTGWVHQNDLEQLSASKKDLALRKTSEDELLNTPLLKAIYRQDVQSAIKHIQSASDVRDALIHGIRTNKIDIVNAAITRGAQLDSDTQLACATVVSAASASPQVLETILKVGGDINCHRFQGVTPLIGIAMSNSSEDDYWAARGLPTIRRSPPVEMVRYAVRRGANLDARNSFGQTALEVSVKENNLAIAKALISLGADPKSINVWNPSQTGTTLVMAAFTPFYLVSDPSMLELVLSSGANPNVLNPGPYNKACVKTSCPWSGQTALTRAIHDNSVTLVKILLAYGADPRVRRADGKLPYDIAISLKHHGIAELLKATTENRALAVK
jgi:ankyrin repeat protein